MKRLFRAGLLLAAAAIITTTIFSAGKPVYAASDISCNYGFHVEADGTITVGGKPYYGVGVNFYDGFLRYAGARPSVSSEDTIKKIAEAEIPFMRVSFGAFRSQGNMAYITSPKTYFKYMDQFVQWAEENKVGIVATLFWSISAGWTPLVENAKDKDIGNPNSDLIKLMLKYVDDVVSRYKDSPAIWGWEVANEINLSTDTNSASQLTLKDVQTFYSTISSQIRKHDTYRMISSGDATYRKEQYNLSNGKGWIQDTKDEFFSIVPQFAPGNVDTISCHPYANDYERFNQAYTVEQEMKDMVSIAKANKKALFVGEFGVSNGATCASPEAPAELKRKLNAIKSAKVQLSAVWNIDMVDMNIETGYYPEQSFAVTGPTAYKYTQTREINEYYRKASMQDNTAGWTAYDPSAKPVSSTPASSKPSSSPNTVSSAASQNQTSKPVAASSNSALESESVIESEPELVSSIPDVSAGASSTVSEPSDKVTDVTPENHTGWYIFAGVLVIMLLASGGVLFYFIKVKK